jgi:predicted  nucleic acid-binding Zn-ribbon protein
VVVVLAALVGPAADVAWSKPTDLPLPHDVRPRTIAEAQANLDRIVAEQAAAEQRLVDLEAERDALRAEFAGLQVEQQELVTQLEDARRKAHELAVGAYIAGGSSDQASYLFASEEASDLAWRQEMLQIHTDATESAADDLQVLSEEAERELGDLADRGEQNASQITQTETDLTRYPVAIRIADAQLFEARAEEAARRAAAAEGGWAALRRCESGGNYQTNTGNGFYGAYQFDLQTWGTVGGTGLPSDAPPEEQDARAKALYAQRGSQPWPVCGRHLG